MASYLPNITDIFPEPSLYTPDFSFLDTMLRRKQAQYDAGFAKINSAYGALVRDVTNPKKCSVKRNLFKTSSGKFKKFVFS